MKKTKQRYVALKLISINVYTCILLNATVSGIIFEILTSNDQRSLFGKNNLGAFNSSSPKPKLKVACFLLPSGSLKVTQCCLWEERNGQLFRLSSKKCRQCCNVVENIKCFNYFASDLRFINLI